MDVCAWLKQLTERGVKATTKHNPSWGRDMVQILDPTALCPMPKRASKIWNPFRELALNPSTACDANGCVWFWENGWPWIIKEADPGIAIDCLPKRTPLNGRRSKWRLIKRYQKRSFTKSMTNQKGWLSPLKVSHGQTWKPATEDGSIPNDEFRIEWRPGTNVRIHPTQPSPQAKGTPPERGIARPTRSESPR